MPLSYHVAACADGGTRRIDPPRLIGRNMPDDAGKLASIERAIASYGALQRQQAIAKSGINALGHEALQHPADRQTGQEQRRKRCEQRLRKHASEQ